MESSIREANLSETARNRINAILEKARMVEQITDNEEMIEAVQCECSREIRKIINLFN